MNVATAIIACANCGDRARGLNHHGEWRNHIWRSTSFVCPVTGLHCDKCCKGRDDDIHP